ncbi:MAG TPA: nuclear transport factor 2 family protein [Solirubrobacteraceae bacterium]|nr:nuclear transport factor 2 family protein [Solirubrobacteraceae bacterium]
MSHENVEIARRVYAASASLLRKAAAGEDISEAPELVELFDPDVVIVEVVEYPDASIYRGRDQMRRWLMGWLDAYDGISIEPQDFVAVGDHVMIDTRQRFRSKVGIELEQDITQVMRFRDGRMIHATGYRDRSNALKAVGLAE